MRAFPYSSALMGKPIKGPRKKYACSHWLNFPREPRLRGITYAVKDRSRMDHQSFMAQVAYREAERKRRREYDEMDRKLAAIGLTFHEYAALEGPEFDAAKMALDLQG